MAPPGKGPHAAGRELHLRVPAQARYAALARTAVTGVAARNGCDDAAVDELEESFDRAFGVLLAGDGPAVEVTVTVDAHADALEVEVTGRGGRDDRPVRLRAQR